MRGLATGEWTTSTSEQQRLRAARQRFDMRRANVVERKTRDSLTGREARRRGMQSEDGYLLADVVVWDLAEGVEDWRLTLNLGAWPGRLDYDGVGSSSAAVEAWLRGGRHCRRLASIRSPKAP